MSKIPFDIKVLLFGIFVSCCASFGSIPFLSLYLREHKIETLIGIGGIIAIPYLTASILGFIGGKISDLVGTKYIPVACFGMGLGFLLYGFCSTIIEFVLTSILIGVARSFFEPAIKALLHKKTVGASDQVFRLRYLAFCFGAIIGPIIGGVLYEIDAKLIFVFTFVVFSIYSLIIFNITRKEFDGNEVGDRKEVSPGMTLQDWFLPFKDKNLLMVIIVGTLSFLMVAVFEAVVPLVLRENFERPARIFSFLFSTSAAISIAAQIPLTYLSKKVDQKVIMMAGAASFAMSYLIFSLSTQSVWPLFVATFFYAIGESVILPGNEVLLGDIAPNDLKATYYGIGEIRQLGFSFGPIIGTVLLSSSNQTVSLQIISMLAIITLVLYAIIQTKTNEEGVVL